MKVERGPLSLAILATIIAVISVLLILFGCAGRKPVANVPLMPPAQACGYPVVFEFEDKHQETWIYTCWPEKPAAKCIKGCE